MKKGCVIAIVLGLLVALSCAGLFALIWGMTQPVADASDRFLGLLGEGKFTEAYASSGQALKSAQDEARFTAAVKQMGLDQFASSSWSSRNIENDVGRVKGTLTTKSGGALPLEVVLVKEGGEWRVVGMESPAGSGAGGGGGAVSGPPRAANPPDADVKLLARGTLLAFNDAVKQKSFKDFHARACAVPFQQQNTPEKLDSVFGVFIEKEIDFSSIADLEAVLDAAPALDGDGVLAVSGYFPTQPVRVSFKLRYAYEHPDWKVVGIKVDL